MQRGLICFILFLLLFPLGPGAPARAQTLPMVHVVPAKTALEPGESTTVAVWVENVPGMRAFSTKILFNPTHFEASGLTLGSFLPDGIWILREIDNSAGTIVYENAIFGDDVQTGSGVLFSFTLTAKKATSGTTLHIDESILIGFNHLSIEHNLQDATLTIIGDLLDESKTIYLPLFLSP